MSVFNVTENANRMSGVYTRPYLVRNAGSNTVYLGQDSSLSVGTQSISMPPGSTLNWSGKTELWALTDPGLSSQVEILYTGDSAFTPGPSTVSISRDTATLYKVTTTSGGNLNTGIIDVTRFNSIALRISFIDATFTPTAFDITTAGLNISVSWFSDAAGTDLIYDESFPVWSRCNNTLLRLNTKGGYVRILSILPPANTRIVASLTGTTNQVLETYNCYPDYPYYTYPGFSAFTANNNTTSWPSTPAAETRAVTISASLPATSQGRFPMPLYAGPAAIGWGRIVQVGTGATTLAWLAINTLSFIHRAALSAAGTVEFNSVSIMHPLQLSYVELNTSGAAVVSSLIYSVQYDTPQF